jgi:membrane protease YdiL (CAAX protease family)
VKNKLAISNIILFFIIALGWSCGIWILLIPSVQETFGLHLDPMWAWLGLIGPGLSAVVISIKENRLLGLRRLFTPLTCWCVPIVYYLIVYVGVFVFYAGASWLSVFVYGDEGAKSLNWLLDNIKAPFFNLHGIWVIIEITIIYTLCEELGWRGYALPKINNYLTGLSAALIIGILWTLWHVPLIYLYGSSLNIDSSIIYFFHIECMSIFYAWLYFKADRSLLLTGLFHGTTDGIGAFFPMTHSMIGQGPNLPTLVLEIFVAIIMIPYLWKIKKSV